MAKERQKLRIYTGNGGGGGRTGSLLPGAKYDWEREAGLVYLNDCVSIACNWVAEKINGVPLVVQERQTDDTWAEVRGNPLAELWAKGNDNYDSFTRDIALTMSVITSGNGFLYIERDQSYGEPIGLHWLDSRYMYPRYPVDGSDYLSFWQYQLNGMTHAIIPAADVLHFRWGIDPQNDRLGLSKLKALMRQLCLLNDASGYAVSILKNSGVPGLVVTPDDASDELDDDDGEEIRSSLNRMTTGDKRGSTIAVNRRIKILSVGFSPEQMSLDKLPNGASHSVFAAIGVSAEALGLPTATKTYENYPTALKAAWESGVKPNLNLIRSAVTRRLMPEFGLDPKRYRIAHDFNGVSELQEAIDARHKRALESWNAGTITLNQFLEETGRPADVVFGDRYRWEILGGKTPTSAADEDQDEA